MKTLDECIVDYAKEVERYYLVDATKEKNADEMLRINVAKQIALLLISLELLLENKGSLGEVERIERGVEFAVLKRFGLSDEQANEHCNCLFSDVFLGRYRDEDGNLTPFRRQW